MSKSGSGFEQNYREFEKQQLLIKKLMPRHSSKALLQELFTGWSDFESYVTHFEHLSCYVTPFDLILRGILESIENSLVRIDLRKNLGDADITLDKALERALLIEASTTIEEEDNEPRGSAIQSNENTQLVNSINDLVRTLQDNQSNRQDNQKFSSQGARPKEFRCGSERSSRETEVRNRNYNSYNRSSADNRRTNCDSRARSPTPRGENRSQEQQLLNKTLMPRHSSKTLLPELFTGSNDFESYVTHFELLLQLQKWQRKETETAPKIKLMNNRITLSYGYKRWLLISIIHFWRTLGRALMRP